MTLEEAKAFLSVNGIPFEVQSFKNEAAYWRHVTLFPYTKNAKPCPVTALIVRSDNGKKNIELQFNEADGIFRFEELRFGDYDYEMFSYPEAILAEELLGNIQKIRQGNAAVIVGNDLKKQRWLGDACFALKDEDAFGEPGFQKAVRRIEKPKGFFARLFKTEKQYEIYDWNSYRSILR